MTNLLEYHWIVYSLLNVLSLYHDSVLVRSLASLPPSARPNPSAHARYTRHYTTSSPPYAALSRTLTILCYGELLIEMGIQKRLGHQKSEKVVLAIECFKAVLRLGLMKVTGGRTSVQPALPEREIDPAGVDIDVGVEGDQHQHPNYWKGGRTGNSHPTLASLYSPLPLPSPIGDDTLSAPDYTSETKGKEAIKAFLTTKVLTIEDAKRPEDLILKARGLAQLAEVMWILRPVIYGSSCRSTSI